jgi:hypothetical protein
VPAGILIWRATSTFFAVCDTAAGDIAAPPSVINNTGIHADFCLRLNIIFPPAMR